MELKKIYQKTNKIIFDFSISVNLPFNFESKHLFLHCFVKDKGMREIPLKYYIENRKIYFFAEESGLDFDKFENLKDEQFWQFLQNLLELTKETKHINRYFDTDFCFFNQNSVFYLASDLIIYLKSTLKKYELTDDIELCNMFASLIYKKLTNLQLNQNHLPLSYFFEIDSQLEINNLLNVKEDKYQKIQDYIEKFSKIKLIEKKQKDKKVLKKYLKNLKYKKISKKIYQHKLLLSSLILSLFFCLYLVASILKPPVQKDLSSFEIVKKYYQSINKIDMFFLDNVLKTKDDFSDIVDFMHINTSTRIFKEGQSFVIKADTFLKKHLQISNLLINNKLYTLFGIVNLKIKKLQKNDFESEFDYYFSYIENGILQIKKVHYIQELKLRKIRGYLYITDIKNIKKIESITDKYQITLQ